MKNKNNSLKYFPIFYLLLLVVAGCSTSQTQEDVEAGETRLTTYTGVGLNIEGRLDEEGDLDSVPFVGQFLPNQDMRIVGARASSTPGGMPKLQFYIESQKDKKTAVQYRFIWFDEEGFAIHPDQNPWQTLHLAGREVADIGSVARSTKAKAFRLMIRPLDFKK